MLCCGTIAWSSLPRSGQASAPSPKKSGGLCPRHRPAARLQRWMGNRSGLAFFFFPSSNCFAAVLRLAVLENARGAPGPRLAGWQLRILGRGGRCGRRWPQQAVVWQPRVSSSPSRSESCFVLVLVVILVLAARELPWGLPLASPPSPCPRAPSSSPTDCTRTWLRPWPACLNRTT